MGSPFPGMDPFLEGELWQEFHETLANAIRAQLMQQLRPKYVALLAKRYEMNRPSLGLFELSEQPPLVFYPDVHVVERGGPSPIALEQHTLTLPSIEIPSGLDVPQLSIEIRDVAERRLVTVIEILSPSNKYGAGAYEYTQRRAELLHAWINLLEIDLLRGGRRIALGAIPPAASYYVYLVRAVSRHSTSVWAIQLPDRLPRVPVPLMHPDPDATLDLQAAVDSCFDLVGYERLLDYSADLPAPELSQTEQDWVAARVRGQGSGVGGQER